MTLENLLKIDQLKVHSTDRMVVLDALRRKRNAAD